MKIKLSKLLDIISQETQIKRKDIIVDASYPEADEEYPGLESFPSESSIKDFLLSQYATSYDCQKYLSIRVFAKNCQIFSFEAKDINPRDNDIYKFMSVKYYQDCIGPGFYYYYPYLSISSSDHQDKSNYLRFLDAVVIDTEKVDVFDTPKVLLDDCYSTEADKKILRSIGDTSLNESFFKKLSTLEKETKPSVNTNQDEME